MNPDESNNFCRGRIMVCLPYVHYTHSSRLHCSTVHAGNGLVRQLSDIRQIVQYEREDTTSCLVSESSWQALMSVGNTYAKNNVYQPA
jgi:hypothetical protein